MLRYVVLEYAGCFGIVAIEPVQDRVDMFGPLWCVVKWNAHGDCVVDVVGSVVAVVEEFRVLLEGLRLGRLSERERVPEDHLGNTTTYDDEGLLQ